MASNDWQEIPLGCLGRLRKGVDFGCHQEGSGIPVVKVKDFGDRLFVPHCDLDELNDSQTAIPKSQLLQKDDIVIIRSNGNSERLGLSMIYSGSAQAATYSGCCIRFRPDTKRIDPLFAAYFLRSPTCRQRLSAFGCGTGIQNLSQRILSEMPVPLPPLGQQKAIAHVLSTLDNKIELNRRMNETLEAIVAAIFKSWFVDCDHVRAKAGLPKSIGDLFPDRLVESELGKIPKGWEVQPIREVIDALFDGPHATPPESAEGPVFLRIKNLTGTQLDLTNVRHISEEHWSRWTERVTPKFGDIVFSYEAVLGSFALIPPDLRCCLGRRLALIRPRKSDPFRYFLFHSFVSAPFQRMLIERSTHGSTVDRVPLLDFPNYLLVWPPARVRSVFDEIAESFWAIIHRNQKESRTLAAIRDTLLPKLLSGDIHVEKDELLVRAST